MPVAVLQVPLNVQPTTGGEAELLLPENLRNLNYEFLLVKDGGTEAIIQLEAPESTLAEITQNTSYSFLTNEQVKDLLNSYPKPKLKKKYRPRQLKAEEPQTDVAYEPYETDSIGQPIVDTIQTVRSGFYLIDVPVLISD